MTDTHVDTQPTVAETIDTQFKALQSELQAMTATTKGMQDSLKALHKSCRTAQKQTSKKVRVQAKNTLSEELEKFLSVAHGTQLTKAEVMKGISTYIKDKNLQLADNKRTFKADKKMQKVFGMDSKKSLTFVEIGGHISGHLTKV